MSGRYYSNSRNSRSNRILSILLVVLSVILCAAIVLLLVLTLSEGQQPKPTDPTGGTTTVPTTTVPPTTVPPTTVAPTEPPVPAEALALMEEAEFIAAGYDYEKAIAMLEGSPYFSEVSQMAALVALYRELDS